MHLIQKTCFVVVQEKRIFFERFRFRTHTQNSEKYPLQPQLWLNGQIQRSEGPQKTSIKDSSASLDQSGLVKEDARARFRHQDLVPLLAPQPGKFPWQPNRMLT